MAQNQEVTAASWEELLQSGQTQQSYQLAKEQIKGSNSDFILGTIALREQNLEVAKNHFLAALKKSPDLADYTQLLLGKIYFEQKEYQKAVESFKKSEDRAKIKYTADVARFYQAEAFSALKQWKKSEVLYQKVSKKLQKTPYHPALLWGFINTLIKNNKPQKICRSAKELYLKFPSFEKTADWGIFLNENTLMGKKINCVVTTAEQKLRVQRLLWAGLEEKALREIEELKAKASTDSKYEMDELYVSYLLHEGHVDEARKVLQTYAETKENDHDYLMLMGKIYSRTLQPEKGVEAYYRAYQVTDKPPLAATALFQSSFLSYIVKDYAGASEKFKEFSEKYPKHKFYTDSLWYLAWLKYLQKDYINAEKSFRDILEAKKSKPRIWHDHKEDKINYWIAMSLLRRNLKEEALQVFSQLTHDDSVGFYSIAAYQRRQALTAQIGQRRLASLTPTASVHENWWLPEAVAHSTAKNDEEEEQALPSKDPFEEKVDALLSSEDAASEIFPEEVQIVGKESHLAKDLNAIYFNSIEKSVGRAKTLSRLGLNDFAYREVLESEGKKLTAQQKQWILQAHQAAGSYNRAVVLASHFFEDQAVKRGLHHATDYWNYSYPKAYEKSIVAQSKSLKIPEELIWSIIRAETLFRADAISPVGARGLMQVMPRTARKLASLMSADFQTVDDLLKPQVSIRYGSFYLQRLMKKFKNNISLTAAAYNGGPHRVHAWMHYFGHLDLDEFIEHIPYLETRNYVKKVTKYYAVYNLLYKKKTNATDFLTKPIGFKMEGSIPTAETWER